MPIIDVQVHPYERNHPDRPWAAQAHGLESATGEDMVAAMDLCRRSMSIATTRATPCLFTPPIPSGFAS